jgi:hypothetical protein
MRLKEQYNYRITPSRKGEWSVYDLRLQTLVAVFDSPLAAADWAREQLIKQGKKS